MRYFILLCFLFFSNLSYAFIPSENTSNAIIHTLNSEAKPKKEIKRPQKIKKKSQRKLKKQLKKQTQKLKWQVLKNALKATKNDRQSKKDKKTVYRSSRISALVAILGNVSFAIGLGTSGVFFGALLFAVPFSIIAFIHAIKSIRFMKANPKEENNTYNRTGSIILTVIGMYLSIPMLSIAVLSLFIPFFIM